MVPRLMLQFVCCAATAAAAAPQQWPVRPSFHYRRSASRGDEDNSQHSQLISAAETRLRLSKEEEGESLYLFSDASVRSGKHVLKEAQTTRPYFAAQLGVAAFRDSYANPLFLKAKPGYRYQLSESAEGVRKRKHAQAVDSTQEVTEPEVDEKWHFVDSDFQQLGLDLPTSDAVDESVLTPSALAAVAEAEAALMLFRDVEMGRVQGREILYFTDSLDLVRSLELGFFEVRTRGELLERVSGGRGPGRERERSGEELTLYLQELWEEYKHQNYQQRDMTSTKSVLPPWFAAYRLLRQSGLLAAVTTNMRNVATAFFKKGRPARTSLSFAAPSGGPALVDESSFRVLHVSSASVLRRALDPAPRGASFSETDDDSLQKLRLRGPFMLGNQFADDLASAFHLLPQSGILDLLSPRSLLLAKRKLAPAPSTGKIAIRDGRDRSSFAFYGSRGEILGDLLGQASASLTEALRIFGGNPNLQAEEPDLDTYLKSAVKQYQYWKANLSFFSAGGGAVVHSPEGEEVGADSAQVGGAGGPPPSSVWARLAAHDRDSEKMAEERVRAEEAEAAVARPFQDIDVSIEEGEPEVEVFVEISALDRFRAWARGVLPKVPLPGSRIPLFHVIDSTRPPASGKVDIGFAGTALSREWFLREFGEYEEQLTREFVGGSDQWGRRSPDEDESLGTVDKARRLAQVWSRLRVLVARVRPWVLDTEGKLKSLHKLVGADGAAAEQKELAAQSVEDNYSTLSAHYADEAVWKLSSLPVVEGKAANFFAQGDGLEVLKKFIRKRNQEGRAPLTEKQLNQYFRKLVVEGTTQHGGRPGQQRQRSSAASVAAPKESLAWWCQTMRDSLQESLQIASQMLRAGTPKIYASTGEVKGYGHIAKAFADELRVSALPEIQRAIRVFEEEFLALVEEIFGEVEDGHQEDVAQLAAGGDEDEDVVNAGRLALAQEPAARSQRALDMRALTAQLARMGITASPEDEDLHALAAELARREQAEQALATILHKMQFSLLLNDVAQVNSIVRREFDHLEMLAPKMLSDHAGPMTQVIQRKTAATFFREALEFTDHPAGVMRFRGTEVTEPHGWAALQKKQKDAGRHRGQTDFFPGTLRDAVAFVRSKGGSLPKAAGSLPVTPWEVLRLLSEPFPYLSSDGRSHYRSLAWSHHHRPPDLNLSALLRSKEPPTTSPSAVVSKEPPASPSTASDVRLFRAGRGDLARALEKYGTALLDLPSFLYDEDPETARQRIELKKTELVNLFFEGIGKEGEEIVVPREVGKEALPRTGVLTPVYREELERRVRELLSKLFVDQVALAARPHTNYRSASAQGSSATEAGAPENFGFLHLTLAETDWLNLSSRSLPRRAAGERTLRVRTAFLFEEFWRLMDAFAATIAEDRRRERSRVLLIRAETNRSRGGRGRAPVVAMLRGAEAAQRLQGEGNADENENASTSAISTSTEEEEAESIELLRASLAGRRGWWEALALRALDGEYHGTRRPEHAASALDDEMYSVSAPGAMPSSLRSTHRPSQEPGTAAASSSHDPEITRRFSHRFLLERFLGSAQTSRFGFTFEEVKKLTRAAKLQFAPPKNNELGKIDIDRPGTHLGTNKWVISTSSAGAGDEQVDIVAPVGMLARFWWESEPREEEAQALQRQRLFHTHWLVVKLDDEGFRKAFTNELQQIVANHEGSTVKFASQSHLRATVATQVALLGNYAQVAWTGELEDQPTSLFRSDEDE